MKTNCHKIVQQRCYYVIWWLFEGQVFLTVGLAPIEGALESLEILALRRLSSPPLFRGKNHFELTTPLLDFECMEQSALPKVIFLWEVAWGGPHTHTLWQIWRKKTRKCGSFIYLADMKKRTIFTNCLLDFKHDLTFTFHVLLNCWRLWIQIEISIFQILLNVC